MAASEKSFNLMSQLQGMYPDRVAGMYRLTEREPRFASIPSRLHPRLQQFLRQSGIRQLYEHQSQSVETILQGEHVIIVTGTASGKTFCYNLPVLSHLLQDSTARALYLFPTKALAQDQMGKLLAFGLEREVAVSTYDGDTPSAQRAGIRRGAHIILTNPDMLHVSILPRHTEWAAFFRNLRYIVIDEVHCYRGVFGSHVALVLRRLRRILDAYGSRPQLICTSATVGNPLALAESLTGMPMVLIDQDSSPRGEQWLLLWRPPVIGENGERLSPNTESARLIEELVTRGVKHIAFVRSRTTAELLLKYVQQSLRESAIRNPLKLSCIHKIASYRAGYLPEERRKIEQALFQGELLSVIATNALELGIDVGELEAVLMNGYPGNIASLWQQMGRAGRKHEGALAIFVLHNDPLHAYFAAHPDQLIGQPVEHAHLNPQNPYILLKHLCCAAHEKPLTLQDLSLFGTDEYDPTLKQLEEGEILIKRGPSWHYYERQSPAREVNIRSVGGANYSVIEIGRGRSLATMEEDRVFRTLHPQAIYLHQGETYLVRELDNTTRQVFVENVYVDYYTQPLVDVRIDVLQELQQRVYGRGRLCWGVVRVHEQVMGFERERLGHDEVLDVEPLLMPPRRFETAALWWYPHLSEQGIHDWLPGNGQSKPCFREHDEASALHLLFEGMHALEHLVKSMVPMLTGCDMNDLESTTQTGIAHAGPIAFFVYDSVPGGVGLAEAAYDRAATLFHTVYERLSECKCVEGCPECILLPGCVLRNSRLDKEQAAKILTELILVRGE